MADDSNDAPERLTTEQVARRLGVKPETVYAYVSRGLLHSARGRGGRGSWFDAGEVDRLSARGSRTRPGREAGPVVRTAITLIRDGRLYYRGVDAVELAHTQTFEAVAGWLWSGALDPEARFAAQAELVQLARETVAPLPAHVRLTDRLRIFTVVAASMDPLRFNTQPDAVTGTAGALVAGMVDALPLVGRRPRADARLAARLWPRLTRLPARPEAIDALNAALVLLADHDLATSTFAARVAASTRAHPYAVVAAGLAAFDGPLHGAAPTLAYRLIADAIASGDPIGVYSDRLRTEGRVEGFHQPAYPDGDPRAVALHEFVDRMPVAPRVRGAVDGLVGAARRRAPHRPTIDFALAVLAHTAQMIPDAGEAIFAVARTAGWIAHALEEYAEPGLRLRFSGSYVGPEPGRP